MSDTTADKGAGWLSLEGEEFVRQAHQRLLERPADLASLHNYTARLMAGMSKAQLVAELENSPEGRLVARRRGRTATFAAAAGGAGQPAASPVPGTGPKSTPASVRDLLASDGAEFVRMAYRALLGREADSAGLSHYTQRLAQGESREQIIADLHSDKEGRAYGARIQGLDELQERLGKAQRVRSRPNGAVERATDLLALHGADFLKAAYLAVLGREADPEGFANYMHILESGYSRSHVIAALANSPEARSFGVQLSGLDKLVNAYRRGQTGNWVGWYWRNVKGVESDLPPAREVRRLGLQMQDR